MKKLLPQSLCALLAAGATVAVAADMHHPAAKAGIKYKVAANAPIVLLPGQPFQNPTEFGKSSKELPLPLTVAYTAFQYQGNDVILRTYNGKLVGPTMRVDPNETLFVNLTNNLSKDDPHAVTNLHTHGLHVSPTGNQDNIFLSVDAAGKQSYAIDVPADQRRGTQWFHPHVHGNTSFQVQQGMEGALIVNDDPRTMPASLKVKENIMVVQYLPLETAKAKVDTKIEVPSNRTADETKKKSIIAINGQVTPKITMNQGEVQRWRIVNATPFRTLSLVLGDMQWHEIALDGMYLGTVDTWPAGSSLVLQPGNRNDVLIKAPDDCSKGCAPVNLVNKTSQDDEIIATVEFTNTGKPMPLPTDAEMKPLKTWTDIDTKAAIATSQAAEFEESGCDVKGDMCVDGKTFNINNPPRMLPLNNIQGWNVSTFDKDHVFHIHVNPFQTVRQGPNGPETVWLDTILIPKGATKDKPVQLWTNYEAITGESVFHCHILPHEDLGMMQAINIEPIATGK